MRKLFVSLIVLAGACWGQVTPDCQFTVAFTSSTAQSPAFANKPTATGGLACTSWIVSYWTNGATGVSLQIEGSPDSGGSSSGAYTALTPATSPVTSHNPATGTTSGNILACCDYYPWIRLNLGTFTGTSMTMTVRVYGYRGTSAVVSGGGGGSGGLNQLTQDVTAGPGMGSQAATVVGLDTVPFCSGYTPVNGQFLSYTTELSPNPCYTATVPAIQSTLVNYLQNASLASGTYTSGGAIVGTATQTCTLTAFNGGGNSATATVALTGINTIAGGTALVVTNVGSQFTSAPTSATLGNGTATCSGTATIATVLDGGPSDVSGEYPLLLTPYSPKTTMAYSIGTGSGTTSLQTWVTAAGLPGLAFLPAGAYVCHLHQSRTNGFTGTVVSQCVFQEVDASGNFIATIGTTDQSGNITLTEHPETLLFSNVNIYTFASTSSRVAVVLQLVRTSVGASGSLDCYVGGEADAHITLPVISSGTIQSTTNALVGDGSGNAIAASGTGTNCLLVNGGNTSCGGGGGGGSFTLVEQHTASSSAALNFTTCISSTYDNYEIDVVNLVTSTGSNMEVQVSTNGGSTYDTGNNYDWLSQYGVPAGTAIETANGVAAMFWQSYTPTLASGASFNASLRLYNPASTTLVRQMGGQIVYQDNSNGIANFQWTGIYTPTGTAVNAFRLLPSAGNLTSGTVRCYGISK